MTEGVVHLDVSGYDVWCLEDGTYVFDNSDFPDISDAERNARLVAAGETDIRTVFNAFLIRDHTGLITLVDTGCGSAFGGMAGALPDRLAAVGMTTDQIDRLVFTHLHTDHCGGAIAEHGPVFPNADVFVHEAERAYWATQDHLSAQVLQAYGDHLTSVSDGDAVAPGLTTWHLPGHTPGHMGLRVGSDLVIVGDIIHSEALQLCDPSLSSINDHDPEQARKTRATALSELAEAGVICCGGHMMSPTKFGRIRRLKSGYTKVGP